jgi:polyphosphate glucokinase
MWSGWRRIPITRNPAARRDFSLVMNSPDASTEADAPRILTIDVGGSGIKAAVLDRDGNMLTERARVETPHPCPPDTLIAAIVGLVETIRAGNGGEFTHVAIGFPGVVRDGRIVTAPNIGTEELAGFNLAGAVSERLGRPVRLLNDADLQGLGTVAGKGLEVVITLGTGMGSAIFLDGRLCPHLEIMHHPFLKGGKDYDQAIGDAARKKIGKKKWNRRVAKAIKVLRVVTNFDRLYIGGGNSTRVTLELPPDITLVSNLNALRGGAGVWRDPHGQPVAVGLPPAAGTGVGVG